MRRFFQAAAVLLFLAVLLYLPREASAAPTFARQTGMACNTCHFQHFPTLNAFGRAFKSGGYTMIGGQSMVEGDMLSLPSTLNASLIAKVRYQHTNGADNNSGTNKGELQFPDEASLLIGGRAGEHIGFLLEAQINDNAAPAFANFKMPVVYDVSGVNVSVIPFKSDSAGPSYGFELLNTGAVRMIRPLEHRKETSAQQYLGTDGEATGFAFVAAHSLGFVDYTAWAPLAGTTSAIDAGPYLSYARAAVTPTAAGWDLGAGLAWWFGSTSYSTGGVRTREKADAWAFDAQVQGDVVSMPLGVYLTYGNAAKSKAGSVANRYNSSTRDIKKAWSLTGELGVLPGRLTVSAGYFSGKGGSLNGNSAAGYQNATTLGANYNLTQNVALQINNSWYSGGSFNPKPTGSGDVLTTLMLFAAF